MAAVGSRAVIVEDHDALSRGLELVLGKAGIDVVGSARTEQEGYEIILRERPGLAVVDIGLEDGSGVELARRLAESEPDLGVLIYTGLDDEGLLREAIDSGARGFALKAGPARDLVAAARAVASGGSYVDPHLTFVLGESATGEVATLSPREREVMAALAEGLKGPPGGRAAWNRSRHRAHPRGERDAEARRAHARTCHRHRPPARTDRNPRFDVLTPPPRAAILTGR